MARIGPGGRLRDKNIYPLCPVGYLGGGVFTLPTANGDAITTLIMPSDGLVHHSLLHCSNAGTGTDTPSVIWRTAAAGAGSPMTDPHVDKTGVLLDYDLGGGLADFSANGTSLPLSGQPEGAQIFLNTVFGGGTHTAGGSWECALWLIL